VAIVVLLSILVYLINLQSINPEYIPLPPIANDVSAEENNSTRDTFLQQSNSSSLIKVLNQTLSPSENVNVSSRDKAIFNQTDSTASENQTTLATNGLNDTSANGTSTEMVTNASQLQPQPLFRPPLSLMPAPTQSQQQPSSIQQPTLQPLLNLLPQQPPLSLQQPPPPLMQPSLQQPPPIPPMQQSGRSLLPLIQPSLQQPSSTIPIPPPSSTPLYPVPSFPQPASSYPPPVILSQNSYVDNIGSMHIVGEVLNQAPVTAEFVEIIATFYNAYGQVMGTDFTFADPSDLSPGQRAPFEIIVPEGRMPLYQMSTYGLRVDWQKP
jgi:hypothetical protein